MEADFKARVEAFVSQIPTGKVMTYGQLAVLCGSPRSARVVGGIAHFGDPELPWHRVVNKSGGLASGYPGGKQAHKKSLEAENIQVSSDYRIDIESKIWNP